MKILVINDYLIDSKIIFKKCHLVEAIFNEFKFIVILAIIFFCIVPTVKDIQFFVLLVAKLCGRCFFFLFYCLFNTFSSLNFLFYKQRR